MRCILFIFSVLVSASSLFGQGLGAIPQNVRAANTLDRLRYLTPSDLTYGIPMPEKRLIGDSYLTQRWQAGTLLLYSSEKLLEGYPIRYDLLRDEMEIQSKSGVKVIEGQKIKSFVWIDSIFSAPMYFVNSRDYKNDEGSPMTGFLQILVDGKIPLLKRTDAVIRKANYSVQFDVGEKDDKIIKKTKLYYAPEAGKILPLASSRKKILPIFKDKRKEVERFIDLNKLSMSDEHHLQRLFEYYNSLN
jgi:hypothetical protein